MILAVPTGVELLAFAVGVFAAVTLRAGYLASALWPDRRYWPPGERDWKYWSHWTLDGLLMAVILVLGLVDAGSLSFPWPHAAVVGGSLLIGGGGVALLAERSMGHDETVGVDGDLAIGGPYRYSRNPQYVGLSTATVGFALLSASALVAVLAALRVVHWVVLPFPEERWLRSRHGAVFEEYCGEVSRFVDLRRIASDLRDLGR